MQLDREVLTCSAVMRASAMSMKHALSPVDVSMGQTTDRPSVLITQTLQMVSHCADAEFALTMLLVELEQLLVGVLKHPHAPSQIMRHQHIDDSSSHGLCEASCF